MIVRVFVFALLAALTLASSAWAECAWVLWHKDGGSESWIREDAFDVRTTCARASRCVSANDPRLR